MVPQFTTGTVNGAILSLPMPLPMQTYVASIFAEERLSDLILLILHAQSSDTV